jgi:hypothetical protein
MGTLPTVYFNALSNFHCQVDRQIKSDSMAADSFTERSALTQWQSANLKHDKSARMLTNVKMWFFVARMFGMFEGCCIFALSNGTTATYTPSEMVDG